MLFHPKKRYVSSLLGQLQHSTRLSRSSPMSSQKHVTSIGRKQPVSFRAMQVLAGPSFRTLVGAHPGKALSAAMLSANHGVPISRLRCRSSSPRLYFARPPMRETGVGNEPTVSL